MTCYQYPSDHRWGICTASRIFCADRHITMTCRTMRVLTQLFQILRGREFTEIRTFLSSPRRAQRSQFIQYDLKRWLDFHAKGIKDGWYSDGKSISGTKLRCKEEASGALSPFMAFPVPASTVLDDQLQGLQMNILGQGTIIRSYPLVDIDEDKPAFHDKAVYTDEHQRIRYRNQPGLSLTGVPIGLCGVQWSFRYRDRWKLQQTKAKRSRFHADPSNRIAKGRHWGSAGQAGCWYSHAGIATLTFWWAVRPDKVTPVTSFWRPLCKECGIMPSRTAYNQLELFHGLFPVTAMPSTRLWPVPDAFGCCTCFFSRSIWESWDTHRPHTTPTVRDCLSCIDITGKGRQNDGQC